MTEPRGDVKNVGRRILRRSAQGVSTVRRTVTRRPRLLTYLAIIGPGVITAAAGNDAGGIATFASVGADYGYRLIWVLIPLTFALGIVQEMCARMGAVTGKGLSDLIRERFGVRWTAFVMLALLIANGGVTVSEFAGIAAALELLGVARYISVPIAAIAIWWLNNQLPRIPNPTAQALLRTALWIVGAAVVALFLTGIFWINHPGR